MVKDKDRVEVEVIQHTSPACDPCQLMGLKRKGWADKWQAGKLGPDLPAAMDRARAMALKAPLPPIIGMVQAALKGKENTGAFSKEALTEGRRSTGGRSPSTPR